MSQVTAGLLGLAALPAMAGPTSARPAPGRPGAPQTRQVTLVTGDRVLVGRRDDGRSTIQVRPGPGRDGMRFRTMTLGGHSFVIPSDAQPMIGRGRLDMRLFDIDQLVTWRYDDAHRPDIPVIAEQSRPGTRATVSAGTTTTALPALGMEAMRIDKTRAGAAWSSLTRGARAGALAAGVARLWLDGKRRPSLDVSVPQIGAPAAWRRGLTGKGITVAVLDTGYDPGHPDLKGVVTRARGFTERGDRDVVDAHGHGTHVASIVAGSGAASQGRYRGVAPGAELAVGKVLDDDGTAQDSWIMAGMEWAATGVKARIVNMSLGGQDTQGADPLEKAINMLTARTGALFVVAAGNEGEWGERTVSSPASATAALAVGAVDRADRLAPFSSRGPRLGDFAVKPDLTGPGVGIVAARAGGSGIGGPVGGRYQRLSGTSMATPHVAGAAAILAQRHPHWKAGRLKAVLIGTARPAGTGQLFRQGSGRVDVARAVTQPVTADAGNLSTYLRWPRPRPVVRTVTYANHSAKPVTTGLTVDATRHNGGTAPKNLFRLNSSTVRVPAKGTAKVRVTINPEGVRPGAYAGVLRATTGDRTGVRVILGAYVEPEAHDLRVRVLDRSGRPVESLLTLSGEADGRHEPVWTQGGVARLRVPAGRYHLHGMLLPDSSGCAPAAIVHQSVDLTGDRTVVFDTREAKPVRMTLDEPGARNVSGLEAGYAYHRGRLGYEEILSSPGCPPENSVYVLQARQQGLSYYSRTSWQRQGTPLQHFEVYDHRTGGLPGDPSYTARKADMATVLTTYRAQAVTARGEVLVAALVPGFTFMWLSNVRETRLPATLTLHLTADPRLQWARILSYGQSALFTLLEDRDRAFGKGTYRETWNAAALGPTLDLGFPLATRAGDKISYDSGQGLFSDSTPGHRGHDENATGSVTLTSGGKVLARIGYRDRNLAARVPARPGTYTLTTDARRNRAGLSTRVKVAWTFSSRRARKPETPLPLQVVRWAPRGLDQFNRARGGTTTQIPLWVERNHGTPPAQVERIRLAFSADDGRTWRGLAVRRSGDRWLTSVPNPRSGFVSLRATVTDTRGATVDQTILRAYAVGA